MQSRRLRLILGDQLNASHSWFQQKSDDTIYVIAELHQEAGYVRHHGQKICAFFAAMAAFAEALERAGHFVLHLTLDDTARFSDLPALLDDLISQYQVDAFEYQLPDEYRLRQQLSEFADGLVIDSNSVESEHFYLRDDELNKNFQPNKKHRMEAFYRKMRVRFDLLMEEGKPLGEQWNFDADNRQKLKSSDFPAVPEPLVFANDVTEIIQRLKRHDIQTIGNMQTTLLWPITRQQSVDLLEHFCRYCLINFGRFQDAMTGKLDTLTEDKQWTLYHSRLSFAMNAKILSPQVVVNTAISHFKSSERSISLAQIEGFVRQILGWREFVRGIYWANMPEYQDKNALTATRTLPNWFWTGKTKMRCMQHAIQQSLDYAYAHHIQRLMVTGNFCLIAGIHPDEVDAWYLGIYIDAIEWVEMPNTRGMSQFADGGIVGSKAYAASGNYIKKMSDYCGDCAYQVSKSHGQDSCPLNSLYWHFMQRHQDDFSANPRNRMVYGNWLKKSQQDRDLILARATEVLSDIEMI